MPRMKAKPATAVDDARPASANYHAHALARGLALLEMLADGPQPLTLMEFYERTGLPKSTLIRLLAVLAEMDFVVRVDERPAFRLGHKVQVLSTAYVAELDVSMVAGPYLRELAQTSGQTANLGLLDRDQVLHVCVEEPDRPIRFTAAAGTRDATYCTALGKMLLAGIAPQRVRDHVPASPFPRRTDRTITSLAELKRELLRTAEQGYAFDNNEGSVGLRCLAVPITVAGEQLAAVSVSGPAGEVAPDRLRPYLDQLQSAAAALAGDADVVAALRKLFGSLLPTRGG